MPIPQSERGFNSRSLSFASERVKDIHSRADRANREERERARKLVPRLAARSFHLEDGNTWCQDWIQYQKNTHPLFGLCLHHSLHPIKLPQRLIILLGSVAFGLAVTNVVFLGLLNSNSVVNTVYTITGEVADFQMKYTQMQLQQSILFLWTVGSFLHSTFDLLIWYLAACACFRPGGITGVNSNKCQSCGLFIAVSVVACMVFVATFVVVLRLNEEDKWAEGVQIDDGSNTTATSATNWSSLISIDEGENKTSPADDLANVLFGEDLTEIPYIGDLFLSREAHKYAFLIAYTVELIFALFIYYFFTSTIFFSGVLGCGRIPIIGGRPYELRKIARNNSSRSVL